jgi:hypothetical protein
MPRVVADIETELKRWYQWQAMARETTMQSLISQALQDFRDREGGEVPPLVSSEKKKE